MRIHRLLRWACLCLLITTSALQPAVALAPSKPFRDFVVDSWDVQQGLPQITVLAVTQDSNGYMWFGTQAGLARFDGVNFRRYSDPSAPNMNTDIQSLLATPDGRLWVGTARGILLLENGAFRTITRAGSGGIFPIKAMVSFSGQVITNGPDGLYSPQGNRLVRTLALPTPAMSLLAEDGTLWVGGIGRVYQTDGSKILRSIPLPTAIGNAAVTALARFEGDLWAGTRQGVYRLHNGSWQLANARFGTTPLTVETMLSDREGTLWVATTQGLERLRPGLPSEHLQDTPGSIAVRSLFEDRDGNLWVGSQTEGVTRIWNGYTRRLSSSDGLRNPLIWSLAKAPHGDILLGTGSGVARWRNGRFETLVEGASLPHPEAYALLQEPEQLWIGTRAGAAVYRNGKVETPAALAPLHNAQINTMLRDHANRLWFGTNIGLWLLSPDGTLQQFGEREGLTDSRIRALFETRDGRLLIGSTQGLYEWRNGRIEPAGERSGLSNDVAVTVIDELPNGHLLVGSSSGGSLFLFDGQRWHPLGAEFVLPNIIPFYFGIHQDFLWVAGMQGVIRIALKELLQAVKAPPASRPDLRAQIIINSGFEQPGGQSDKCCNGSGIGRGLMMDDALWLPTRDGVLLVGMDVPAYPNAYAVRIEDVQTDTQTFAAGTSTVKLPLDARNPVFNFTAPAFQPAQMPLLRYQLVGFDQGWRDLADPNQRSVAYANLAPGSYTFKVADFNQADPLAHVANLTIEIPAHVHETVAFLLAMILLGVALIWLGYWGLRYRYSRQSALLERLVQERTRELQLANERLKEISFTDPLTCLHNRRYLAQQLPVDTSFYERDPNYRNGNEAAVFALLDVDHFKTINDTWGHAAGDLVLEQFGQLLNELKRSGDYVARWGGEEFLLILRPLPRGSLASIGQRLCESISAKVFDLGNGEVHQLTASIGLIESPLFPSRPNLLSWEQLVTLADHAMYQVKISGRNGWMACRPTPGAILPAADTTLTGDPHMLIDKGLIELYGSRPLLEGSKRSPNRSQEPV